MDPDFNPDVTLARLRELAAQHGDDSFASDRDHDDVADMAAAFLALDAWLTEGGTLPSGWHLSTCMAHDCRRAEAGD